MLRSFRSLGFAAALSAWAPCALGQSPATPPSTSTSSASTDHLKLRTSSKPSRVAPGGTVTLNVDIEPRRGMHVYAPGDHTYRVISLSLTTPPPFVRLMPMTYPPSEIYHFVPLDERVPVYMKPFTLAQEVKIEDTAAARAALAEARELTLSGTLAYQACDDRLCFNPVSVPITWRVPADLSSSTGSGSRQ